MTSKTRKNSKNGSYSVSDGANTIILSTRELKRQEFTQRKAREAALHLKMTSDEVHFYSKVKKNNRCRFYCLLFFNLKDIRDNIIAMGYPSDKPIQSIIRNQIDPGIAHDYLIGFTARNGFVF